MAEQADERPRTCWFVEGHRCPECGSELCTDGRREWCSSCTYGHRKPRRLQLIEGIEGGAGGSSADLGQGGQVSMSDNAPCRT
jgi:hypothetical protein